MLSASLQTVGKPPIYCIIDMLNEIKSENPVVSAGKENSTYLLIEREKWHEKQ